MGNKPLDEDAELINCDICMQEIPAESEEYFETDAYVRHFCGIECYKKWKDEKGSGDKS